MTHYKHIDLQAYYHSEGEFWVLSADSPDGEDLTHIELSAEHLAASYTQEDVIAELRLIAEMFLSEDSPAISADRVTILFEGNEVETLGDESLCDQLFDTATPEQLKEFGVAMSERIKACLREPPWGQIYLEAMLHAESLDTPEKTKAFIDAKLEEWNRQFDDPPQQS